MECAGIVLTQYVIYDKPSDHPLMFVVREWHIARGAPDPLPGQCWVVPTVERARALIPMGMVCLARHPNDDPAIVEVWT